MTKVRIEPGICGFTAIAEAEAAEDFPEACTAEGDFPEAAEDFPEAADIFSLCLKQSAVVF